jgi:acetate kinase
MEEHGRLHPAATKDRVILAHLGNGASLAAVRHGKSIARSVIRVLNLGSMRKITP